MNTAEIKKKILNILKPRIELLGLLAEDVDEHESLTQSGIMDSFSFLEFVTDLEQEFNIEFDFAKLDPSEFSSISALCNIIYNLFRK